MNLTRKDALATLLTGLVVLVYAATHEGWNVWLVGGSHRWAAGTILLIGIATCGLGTPRPSRTTSLLELLGAAALVLGVVALVTGSLTPLSLLVADIVVLWAASTLRHAVHEPRTPKLA
jgi:hypothetical protein